MCESTFTVTQVHLVNKNSSETYKALSRRFGKATQIFHGMPNSNLLRIIGSILLWVVSTDISTDMSTDMSVDGRSICRSIVDR